jgi:hypothetical protein
MMAAFLFGVLISFPLTLLIIGLIWLKYRPFIGVSLIILVLM